jgi:hypothetical protein
MSTLSRKFIGFQQFTSSGTWVKTPGVKALWVICIGGGRGNSNGGSSSFSTCVGTGGTALTGGTSGTGGDLNLSSGMNLIEPALLTYGGSANVFGFKANRIAGRPNTGCGAILGGTGIGNSGGAAMKLFQAADLPDSVAVTVGAAGGTGSPSTGQVWIFEVS